MICGSCGNEVPEGDKFCTACGWKVPAEEVKPEEVPAQEAPAEEAKPEEVPVQEAPAEEVKSEEAPVQEVRAEEVPVQQYQQYRAEEPLPASPTNPPEPIKVKLDKKVIAIIGAAAALVVILIAVNWASLANMMKRTFSSPEKYYQWVEKNTVKDAAASAASIYGSYLLDSLNVYDAGGSGEITLKLGEAGQDMLELAGLSGLDLSWFESATVTYEGNSRDNVMQGNVGFGLGKDKLLSVDAILDLENEAVFVAIPELSEKYIGIEMDDISDYSYYRVDADASAEAMAALEAVCKKLPEQKQIQKLLSKYFEIALGSVDDVELKKGKTLRAEGITQKCTELEVTIDAKTLANALKAICEELEEDKDVKNIIIKLCDELEKQDIGSDYIDEIDSEEVYEAFQDACKQVRKNAKYAVDSDSELVMTLYVDAKGIVRGRTIEYDDGWDNFEIVTAMPRKGSKFGYKAAVKVDGTEFAITGTGKESGDKLNGEFSVEYNGTGIVDITVKKFDVEELKKGYLNGTFTVKAASGISRVLGMSSVLSMLGDMELTVELSMSAKTVKCALSLTEDQDSWGSISFESNRTAGKKASAPSNKNTIYIEDVDDLEDYWDSINWDSFLKKLDKSDLPSEIIDALEDIADLDADELMEFGTDRVSEPESAASSEAYSW